MEMSRRGLLAGLGAAAAAVVVKPKPAVAADRDDTTMTLIDLTRCDGCAHRDAPACVSACRQENAHRFPDPDPSEIRDYWPQERHEDWRDKRHLTDRLTPYNWTFVQQVRVEHEGRTRDVSVPRRCMHCDNPPCVQLCPFGVAKKTVEGPVYIDSDLCFGGAKCRTVCPWNVPQRQAGVGVYTHLDPLPVGGGVMYKCDLCRDRLARGERPACVAACPRDALQIGRRSDMVARARARAEEVDGHLYGLEENGGTSTVYVSDVPFDAIDRAIVAQADSPPEAMRMHEPANVLEKHDDLAMTVLGAPIAGAAAALTAFVATATREARARRATKERHARSEDDHE